MFNVTVVASSDYYIFKVQKGQSLSVILYSLGIRPYINGNISKYIDLNRDKLGDNNTIFFDTSIRVPKDDVVFQENFEIDGDEIKIVKPLVDKESFDSYAGDREIKKFENVSSYNSLGRGRQREMGQGFRKISYSMKHASVSAGSFNRSIKIKENSQSTQSSQKLQGRYALKFSFLGRNPVNEIKRKASFGVQFDYLGGSAKDLDPTFKLNAEYSKYRFSNIPIFIGLSAFYQSLSFENSLENESVRLFGLGPKIEYTYKKFTIDSYFAYLISNQGEGKSLNFFNKLSYELDQHYGLSGAFELIRLTRDQYDVRANELTLSAYYIF